MPSSDLRHSEVSAHDIVSVLITRSFDSVCEDLVCVSYPSEAWLYRVKLGKGMVDASTLCVIDLRSADGLLALTRCCRQRVGGGGVLGGGGVRDDVSPPYSIIQLKTK